MSLVHGSLLWCIIALSIYALNKGDIAISFGSASAVQPSEEKLREVFKKINENNLKNIAVLKKHLDESSLNDKSESDNNDKLLK